MMQKDGTKKNLSKFEINFLIFLKIFSRYDGNDSIQPVLENIPKWIELGTSFIGGCCNINSENLKKIKNLVEKF